MKLWHKILNVIDGTFTFRGRYMKPKYRKTWCRFMAAILMLGALILFFIGLQLWQYVVDLLNCLIWGSYVG